MVQVIVFILFLSYLLCH